MTDTTRLLADAEAAWRNGRLGQAAALLADVRRLAPAEPRGWHLTALVVERAGRAGEALQALQHAVRLAPNDAGLLTDLADRLGDRDPDAALSLFARAIALAPQEAGAWLGRGRLLHRLRRFEESRADLLRVYQLAPDRIDGWLARAALEQDAGNNAAARIALDRALALDPEHPVASKRRARLALEMGEADVTRRYAALATRLPDDPDVTLGEAEARELDGDPAAAERLAEQVRARPEWVEGLRTLARMRWEAGDDRAAAPFEAALAQRPRDPAIYTAHAEFLAGRDEWEAAADVARRGAAATGSAALALLEARNADVAGDHERAGTLLARLPADVPDRAAVDVPHAIRGGAIERAGQLLDAARAAHPAATWPWPLADIVWRLLGDARAEWLHGQPGLIATSDLGLGAAEIEALVARLRALHRTRQFPIGQSLRGGTQTRGRLLSRPEPEIRRLRDAIGSAVLAYWDGLPPRDDRHPLLKLRDRAPAFAGSWSVRLSGGGHHVAHTHPAGALSSASYWVLPDGRDQGALELGRPPADLRVHLAPRAVIAPAIGALTLFPSTLHHGTRPFEDGERLTVAFDIAVD